MHKLESTECFSMLEWSNNDKWLMLVCSNGSIHVISTIDWKIRKSFPGLNIAIDNKTKSSGKESGVSHSDDSSKETEPGTKRYSNILKGDVRWQDVPEVNRFLATSESFLAVHQVTDPAPALRPLLKCVLMLTIHTKWVSTKDGDLVRRISRVDDGEPVAALIWILGLCTDIMKQAMQKNADDGSFSPSYGLGPRDLRRIQAWNDQWLLVDANASCIDLPLLQDADEIH